MEFWSLHAISYATRQTQSSWKHLDEFFHSVMLSRKESTVWTYVACDTLRSQLPMIGGFNPSGTRTMSSSSKGGDSDHWELVFDPRSDFAVAKSTWRTLVGGTPFQFESSIGLVGRLLFIISQSRINHMATSHFLHSNETTPQALYGMANQSGCGLSMQ
jgi:hypothetical protein